MRTPGRLQDCDGCITGIERTVTMLSSWLHWHRRPGGTARMRRRDDGLDPGPAEREPVMTDALVGSGAGPYADPWHPFPDTSERLAQTGAGLAYTVAGREEVETVLAKPG